MYVSAEIRWFWPGSAPGQLADWFRLAAHHDCGAGGGGSRVDEYLLDKGQRELGIKRRGTNRGGEANQGLEIKGLLPGATAELAIGPFAGPIELWAKWAATGLELRPRATIAVDKRRWLRKFDASAGVPREVALDAAEAPIKAPLPSRGCNVELTEITLPGGERWSTFGFEAFGSLAGVENDLRATAALLLERQPPSLGNAVLGSYPAWLQGLV